MACNGSSFHGSPVLVVTPSLIPRKPGRSGQNQSAQRDCARQAASGWRELFARYASAFAARYPGVQLYTPVNEMFVCATFFAAYGRWSEQLQSDRGFVTALWRKFTVQSRREERKETAHKAYLRTM